jgi:hypothetical protein
MSTTYWRKLMKFWDVFKDDNEFNEKTIIGFMSFAVMVLTSIVDIGTGLFGLDFEIHEYIYNSFVIVTLGSFGIAGVERFSPAAKIEAEHYIKREKEEQE